MRERGFSDARQGIPANKSARRDSRTSGRGFTHQRGYDSPTAKSMGRPATRRRRSQLLLMAFLVDQTIHAGLIAHARRVWPEECCGVLLGRRGSDEITVVRLEPATNIAEGDKRKAYQIDWETLFRTTKAARADDLGIVGFYHSHPDGSSMPSATDTRWAWVDHVYVIVALTQVECTSITAWRSDMSGGVLNPEALAVQIVPSND